MKTIKLTQGKVALVDDEDFERVNQFKWYANRIGYNWYAMRMTWPDRKSIYLHRFVTGAIKGQEVDHINHDTLDCQKHNLRKCTHAQNQRNRGKYRNNKSGYRGVSWSNTMHKWHAQIMVNHSHRELGYFDNPEDAARAYDKASIELFGKFANTNFPKDKLASDPV